MRDVRNKLHILRNKREGIRKLPLCGITRLPGSMESIEYAAEKDEIIRVCKNCLNRLQKGALTIE